jgi:hypothetical protein
VVYIYVLYPQLFNKIEKYKVGSVIKKAVENTTEVLAKEALTTIVRTVGVSVVFTRLYVFGKNEELLGEGNKLLE